MVHYINSASTVHGLCNNTLSWADRWDAWEIWQYEILQHSCLISETSDVFFELFIMVIICCLLTWSQSIWLFSYTIKMTNKGSYRAETYFIPIYLVKLVAFVLWCVSTDTRNSWMLPLTATAKKIEQFTSSVGLLKMMPDCYWQRCQLVTLCDPGLNYIFTARAYARAVLGVVILSVRLSHAWIVTKLNDALQIF